MRKFIIGEISKFSVAVVLILALSTIAMAQSDPHYTMFMYNKLIYNPAYAGSKDLTSISANYRDQWVGIDGAPVTMNLQADGLIGSYMMPFRHMGLGIALNNEKIGVESSTDITGYYSYRILVKETILSMGLSAGAKLYSANYSQLNPFMQNDLNLSKDVKSALLPNFGAGIYWYNNSFFFGASIPNILQNYYDKNSLKLNNVQGRELRGYYLNGGYVYTLNEQIKLEPQIMYRYAGDGTYSLPSSCDFNLSVIALDRFMIGGTYRTDNSFEGIVHVAVFTGFSLGYAYDYVLSPLNGYAGGSHEVTAVYEFIKDKNKYSGPRFISAF
jgi:type IX secretion system PorP/SprF family membrane protein